MSPLHSVDYCPICGGGLCGVRICGLPVDPRVARKDNVVQDDEDLDIANRDKRKTQLAKHPDGLDGLPASNTIQVEPHGLVVCDECEAIWLEPDVSTQHQYPDSEDAHCPICTAELWGPQSRWATEFDMALLGWSRCHKPDLDALNDQGLA